MADIKEVSNFFRADSYFLIILIISSKKVLREADLRREGKTVTNTVVRVCGWVFGKVFPDKA